MLQLDHATEGQVTFDDVDAAPISYMKPAQAS